MNSPSNSNSNSSVSIDQKQKNNYPSKLSSSSSICDSIELVFEWEDKTLKQYFSEVSLKREKMISRVRESFDIAEDTYQFISDKLKIGIKSLHTSFKEIYVIWQVHINNVEKLYRGEKRLEAKLVKYDLMNHFSNVERNIQNFDHDPLPNLLGDLVPFVCQHKSE